MCVQNFVKNSMRVFDDASVAKLWEYLDGIREEISKEEKEQKEQKETAAVVAVTVPVPAKKNAGKSTKKGVRQQFRETGDAVLCHGCCPSAFWLCGEVL